MDNLDQDKEKDTLLLLQLIRDNVVLWNYEGVSLFSLPSRTISLMSQGYHTYSVLLHMYVYMYDFFKSLSLSIYIYIAITFCLYVCELCF